jgi:transcriptional regulator with PAS, ATPase and Fis domain
MGKKKNQDNFEQLKLDFLAQLSAKTLKEVDLALEQVKIDAKTKLEVSHELAMPPEMRRKILSDIGLKDTLAPELSYKYLPHLQVLKRLLELTDEHNEPLEAEKLVALIWQEGRKARLYEGEIQQLVDIFPQWLKKVSQKEILEISPLSLLEAEDNNVEEEIKGADKNLKGIIGKSPLMQTLFTSLRKISNSNLSIFIQGESGTGKELVAHAIHSLSSRAKESFIPVHCGALPETIIESELFGYEKGAFTGALTTKKGFFELAHKGTVFLDEITETSLATQVKLLRVLQEQRFFRLGGTSPVKVDCRIIAASNAEIDTLIFEKMFRQDLYYRINEMTVVLPPLRKRKDDIPLLIERFVVNFAKQNQTAAPEISPEALDFLVNYSWPGNVRELENVVKRAVVLSDGVVRPEHLPCELMEGSRDMASGAGELVSLRDNGEKKICLGKMAEASLNTASETLPEMVADFERRVIASKLAENGGDLEKTALSLGVSKRTIQRKLRV